METYRLKVKNEGTFKGNLAIFQRQADLEEMGAMPLAWFTKGSNPNTMVEFCWNVDYCFVWSEEGILKPGVVFRASQTIDGGIWVNNKVVLDKNIYGYVFSEQTTATAQAGSLIIEENNSIPGGEASVGIGMSGFGTFVWQTEPNANLTIQPKPQYWIAYGTFKQGEVLDIQQLMNTSLELNYPTNKYNATVTLNSDNTWGDVSYE
ncbi:protein rhiA [Crassaminicella profunda]|uniref:protein rhiA n=1 Tax=Crassaminicella profunda TaxID=1286698 RepID=UPI001CA6FC40|nr:protein rhiA [Crassaminicella profunda]QZY54863.1 protein rhiA [Crassaminicella profunda]